VDYSTVVVTGLDAFNTAKQSGKIGEFPIAFTYTVAGQELTVTVDVILSDQGTEWAAKNEEKPEDGRGLGITDPTGGLIGADDHICKTGGSSYTTEQINKITGIWAQDSNGNVIDAADIQINEEELAAINTAKTSNQTGDYPLSYSYTDSNGKAVQVSITVFLRDEGTDDSAQTSPYVQQNGSNDYSECAGTGTNFTVEEVTDIALPKMKDSTGSWIQDTEITINEDDLTAFNTASTAGRIGEYQIHWINQDEETVSSIFKLRNCTVPAPTSAPTPTTDTETKSNQFLVTFLDCNGNTVKVEWVPYQGNATAPVGFGSYTGYTNVSANIDLKPTSCGLNNKWIVPNTADKTNE
jgi:hypothetical protein